MTNDWVYRLEIPLTPTLPPGEREKKALSL